jgi:hypothetical protein
MARRTEGPVRKSLLSCAKYAEYADALSAILQQAPQRAELLRSSKPAASCDLYRNNKGKKAWLTH